MWRSSKTFHFLALVILACSSAFAQRPQVYKILGISVEGHRSSDPSAIIANAGLKVGDEITVPGEQTRVAIERLYGLRLFDDIQILIERRVEDGVYLLIRLTENPRLEKIEFVGNDELSESDLQKKISLTKGQLINRQELANIVRVLKKAYEEDGYLNAEIKPELVPGEDTTGRRVVLKVNIDEGPKVKVDRIRFFGNKAFDDGDLKGEMKETSERAWWKFWASNKFDPKKFKEDKELIVNYYRKNGYRDAEILKDSISYDESKRYLTVDIYVYEGPQYKIRNIRWEGNTVYPTALLNERLGFKTGDVYNKEKFDQNLQRNEEESDVASLYYDNGYLMFQIEPEEIKVGEDSLDFVIKIREGNQFRIGQVMVTGNTKTYEKVIRRELYTRPGDFFSRQAIIRSIRQLAQLNYFNPEKIKPDTRIVDEKTVDLIYTVEEKSSDTFNMSVGYSGAFGFNGALGLTFNNFSITEPLKGGAGQVLNFDWQFGEGNRFRTFTISFTEPWMFDTPTLFGVSVFDTRQIFYYDVRQFGGSIRLGRRLSWPDDFFRGDWSLRFNRSQLNDDGDPSISQEGATTQYGIGQVISRNSTDSPIFPSRGSSISLSSEFSFGQYAPYPPADAGAIVVERKPATYHKHVFSMDWYVPILGSARITLLSSTTLGYIFGFEKDFFIPLQEYFYMGGTGLGQFSTTPLRGYEDRGVGPQSGGGRPLGAKALLKYSTELRFALTINPVPIYTLAFAEAGNTWLDHRTQDPLDLKRAAGIGVRLLINPIGLIGFDYAYGFDAALPGLPPSGWKFHFQFGRSF
ncbi:MAG TPA: outer membrane protein assembly factor BamA [Bacteroidota bacterium]|nr:outer membrane protein assembly factor BamA [Bacteroidota bacterium]